MYDLIKAFCVFIFLLQIDAYSNSMSMCVQGGDFPWFFPVFKTTVFMQQNFIILFDGLKAQRSLFKNSD